MSYFKRLSIVLQLSILTLVIVIVMALIMSINYFRAAEVVKRDNSNYYKGIILQLNHTISSNSYGIKRLIETVAYGQTVQNYFYITNPAQKFEAYNLLKGYLSDMMGMKDGILDIALVGRNSTFFNLRGDTGQYFGIAQEIPKNVQFYYAGYKELTLVNNTTHTTPVLVAGAPIYSANDFNKDNELGTILLVIDLQALFGSGVSVNLPNGASIYMTDRNGRVFYTNDDSIKLGNTIPSGYLSDENRQYLIQRDAIPDLNGEIDIKMPNRLLLKGVNDIRKQQLILVAVALILLIVPFLFVINNILQPLKKLMRLMSEVRLGQKNLFGKRVEVEGYVEIAIMSTRFNEMMTEIEDLTYRLLESNRLLYETELIKRRAEISYLQSQINPHFLYNTLESIKGIAVDEGSTKIFELTKALALFFRFSIKGPDMVSLERELAIIKNYIYIHQIRFGDRLQVEYNFDTESLGCMIPKMILQPIVENAIFHGIEPLERNGLLVIKGYTDEENLYLTIQDNGTGISSDRLEGIHKTLASHSTNIELDHHPESSIGLINVHDRIRIKFGEEYGIQITSKLQGGTQVLIKLPVRSEWDVL